MLDSDRNCCQSDWSSSSKFTLEKELPALSDPRIEVRTYSPLAAKGSMNSLVARDPSRRVPFSELNESFGKNKKSIC